MVDRYAWQPVCARQGGRFADMADQEAVGRDDDAGVLALAERRDGGAQRLHAAHRGELDLGTTLLDDLPHEADVLVVDAGVEQQRRALHRGDDLAQQAPPFADQLGIDEGEARDVAAGPGQGLDEAERHRVDHQSADDGNGRGCLLERHDVGRSVGQDHVGLQRHELVDVAGDGGGIARCPALLDADGLAVDPAEGRQPLLEGCQPLARVGVVRGERAQHAHERHAALALRPRRSRPRGETAEKTAPPHSMILIQSPRRHGPGWSAVW